MASRTHEDGRHFPPPWSVDGPDTKLGQDCYIVRDANGQALAYVYFEDESGRGAAAFSPKTTPVCGFT
jgi:FtsP/CotA-like multicopper oxidase with cupredoxin domain